MLTPRKRPRVGLMGLLAALLLALAAGFACAEEDAYALLISEAQSNNDADWALGFCDYVELYNAGEQALLLSDYCLTRDADEPFDCPLPELTLAPDSYALLVSDVDIDLHLPKEGCALYLVHLDGTQCDEAALPAMADIVWQV